MLEEILNLGTVGWDDHSIKFSFKTMALGHGIYHLFIETFIRARFSTLRAYKVITGLCVKEVMLEVYYKKTLHFNLFAT